MTFSEFIAEKGVRPLALAMGVAEPTVYSWSSRQTGIPRDRWDRLMTLYPRLTYRQLVDMEIESKAVRADK